MNMMKIKVFPNPTSRCMALIDQKRYIGGDPVGRRCYNIATTFFLDTGHAICKECLDLLPSGSITLPDALYREVEYKF